MIQRIQTVYFLLAIACLGLACYFPLYNLNISTTNHTATLFKLTQQPALLAVTVICALGIIYNIFLYKNRRLQMTVCGVLSALVLLLNILIAITYSPLSKDNTVQVQPAAFFPLVALFCLLMAARGIRKDEKLVRSTDRLR